MIEWLYKLHFSMNEYRKYALQYLSIWEAKFIIIIFWSERCKRDVWCIACVYECCTERTGQRRGDTGHYRTLHSDICTCSSATEGTSNCTLQRSDAPVHLFEYRTLSVSRRMYQCVGNGALIFCPIPNRDTVNWYPGKFTSGAVGYTTAPLLS
jgi:hypothetical protein